MLRHQGQDQFLQGRSFNNLVELVKGEIDAVVGNPPLRKIIGADALGAVAGADLFAAVGGAHRIDALLLAS